MIPYIYLLDRNPKMTAYWQQGFTTEIQKNKVEVVQDEFTHFMYTHPQIDAVVSPANSFGLMDGGYDKAIIEYFGEDLQETVQNKLQEEYLGEQPVGTCMKVPIPKSKEKVLLHTPTMRMPEPILDPRIIYTAMRSALVTAIKCSISTVVVPAFGGCTGAVPEKLIARLMYEAYKDVCYRDTHAYKNNWENIHTSLNLEIYLKEMLHEDD